MGGSELGRLRLVQVLAAVVVAGTVSVVGSGPADAAQGSKLFLKDCRLVMMGHSDRGGVQVFEAYDRGTECDEYFLRGISIVTTAGEYRFVANSSATPPPYERLWVSAGPPGEFAYGTVDVYIPYKARCDRYRLYAHDVVRFLDSRTCGAPPTPTSTDYGGYIATAEGPRTVRAGFGLTTATCDGEVAGAIHGVTMEGTEHLAAIDYLCAIDGTLKYLVALQAGTSSRVVQRPAAAGDQVRMSVRIDGTTVISTVRNVTRGWTETETGTSFRTSRTAIVGTLPFDGTTPLANFAPVTFTNVTVSDGPLSGAPRRRVILTNSLDEVRVVPSTIVDGGSFTNPWLHA